MTRLRDRVCVITGAGGIAGAAARRFAEEGATVFTISIDDDECAVLHDGLPGRTNAHGWVAADLRNEDEAVAAFASCIEEYGRIDGLFAVAGGSGRSLGDGPVDSIPLEGWQGTLGLNLTTSFLAVRETLKQMMTQAPSGGSIVVTSSVLAGHPSPQHFATHAYSTAKGAQLALVRATAAHYAPLGIRVNAIEPGLVLTPMSARAQDDEVVSRYIAGKQPLAGGIIPPEDVAATAAFLLSDDARSITGQTLAVDGGWSVTEAPA
jgi:NAD(P)-dependent dehydrogenase (short-subunit alcohol dehydrogenase family)